jgi:hypothetical protein
MRLNPLRISFLVILGALLASLAPTANSDDSSPAPASAEHRAEEALNRRELDVPPPPAPAPATASVPSAPPYAVTGSSNTFPAPR